MIPTIRTLRSWLREVRVPTIIVLVYLAARFAFALLAADDGLLTPGGSPRVLVVTLGLLVLALRVVVFFVLPALVAYRLVVGPRRHAR